MPVDGAGNITRPGSPIPVTGQEADAPQVNVPIDDIYAALNMLMFLDGRKSLRGNIPMNGYRAVGASDAVGPQDYVTLAQLQSMLFSVPLGGMIPYTISSSAAPENFAFPNGAALSRAAFSTLWAAVQAGNNLAASEGAKEFGQYGPGNGSTTFTLPNLMVQGGLFVRSTAPAAPGFVARLIGRFQQDAFASHNHGGSTGAAGAHNHIQRFFLALTRGFGDQGWHSFTGSPLNNGVATSDAPNHVHTIPAQGDSETRPKNVSFPYIIRVR